MTEIATKVYPGKKETGRFAINILAPCIIETILSLELLQSNHPFSIAIKREVT